MTIYRLHRAGRATADYTRTELYGGRWNPPGVRMLYAASSLSLSCLEVLVHLDKTQFPMDFVWSKAELQINPDFLIVQNPKNVAQTQSAGRAWVSEKRRLAIRVPSVLIPEDHNILLNPTHRGYALLKWQEPRPFEFDVRLFYFDEQADSVR
jgi:RES domain-containing protein